MVNRFLHKQCLLEIISTIADACNKLIVQTLQNLY